jgi:hypothetical protein
LQMQDAGESPRKKKNSMARQIFGWQPQSANQQHLHFMSESRNSCLHPVQHASLQLHAQPLLRFRLSSQCKHTPCVISRNQTHVPQTTHIQLHLPVNRRSSSSIWGLVQNQRRLQETKKNPRELPMSQLDDCLWALSASRMLSTHLPTATWETITMQ